MSKCDVKHQEFGYGHCPKCCAICLEEFAPVLLDSGEGDRG